MIYTFYSFKGGVGRSMALANVAEKMYTLGLKVLLVDFDLEAPGLERYFDLPKALSNANEIEGKRGLIDLMVSYNTLRQLLRPAKLNAGKFELNLSSGPTLSSLEDIVESNWAGDSSRLSASPSIEGSSEPAFPVEPLKNFVHQIYAQNEVGGEIHILPAGQRTRQLHTKGFSTSSEYEHDREEFARYAERVRAFPWNDFYTKWEGQQFFEWFRKEAEAFADVVLIDSRTGVTEMSGICTYHLADVVVMFAAPNKQNLDGTKMIADSLAKPSLVTEGRKGRKLSLLFVPSRVDSNEKSELDGFARLFNDTFNSLMPIDLTFETNAFVDLTIPYVAFYSFREEIAVRDLESPVAILLIKPYEKICLTLAKLDATDGRLRSKYDPQQIAEGNLVEQQNRFAEYALAQLTAEEQQLARRVAMRMVRLSPREEGGADTCVRVNVTEFDEGTMKIVTRLAEVGLVVIEKDEVTGSQMAQLPHEAFINNWERLRNWLDKDRGFLIWRQRIKTNIEQWNSSQREKAALLSGNSLNEAEYWLGRREQELTDTENLYIVTSARHRTRLRKTKIAAVGLAIIFLVVFGIFQWQGYKAKKLEAEKRKVELTSSYLSSGDKSLQNDDFTSAIDSYSLAISLIPENAEALNKRGKAYAMVAKYDEAFRDLNLAVELKPDYAEAYVNRGLVYLKKSQWDEAIADFIQATKIRPDYAEGYYYLGNAYGLKGDRDQALDAYTRAIILRNDNYPEAYLQRGLIYKKDFEKNRTATNAKDQAISDFTRAISFTTIPALRTEAEQNLLQLAGASQNPDPQPPHVFIHYNDPSDETAVATIVEAIRGRGITVQGMQPGDSYTIGDIRYYYPEDRKNASKVQEIVSESLKAQKHELNIKLRFLGGTYYKNVQPGSIEVWIPPLSTPLNSSKREEKLSERDSGKGLRESGARLSIRSTVRL